MWQSALEELINLSTGQDFPPILETGYPFPSSKMSALHSVLSQLIPASINLTFHEE
jgi:hypothetical protein